MPLLRVARTVNRRRRAHRQAAGAPGPLAQARHPAHGQEVNRLLELVHPDLEWTYLDLAVENPRPQTCRGRQEPAEALGQQAEPGLVSAMREIASSGDKVMVTVHAPGAGQRRGWQAEDGNYLVLTLERGRIVAMRALRDGGEAYSFTGRLGQGAR